MTDEGQIAAYKEFGLWAQKHPVAATIAACTAVTVFFGALLFANFNKVAESVDTWRGNSLEEQMRERALEEEAKGVDEEIANIIFDARLRAGGVRSVGRVFIYALDDQAQLVAVEDVFESMDPKTEGTGIRHVPLPLENIQATVSYMLQDPGNPRCIARNAQEYDDEGLRNWLELARLKSSVACPIVVKTRLQGLLAISSRAPLERNPGMERVTRDAALKLTGFWARSRKVKETVERIQRTSEK